MDALRLLDHRVKQRQHESLARRQPQRGAALGLGHGRHLGQAVKPGCAGHLDLRRRLAHTLEPLTRPLGGDKMPGAELADRMAHRFIDGTRTLAAVDMHTRDTQMQRGNGARQHLAPVAEQQQQFRLFAGQQRRQALKALAHRSGHALRRAGDDIDR